MFHLSSFVVDTLTGSYCSPRTTLQIYRSPPTAREHEGCQRLTCNERAADRTVNTWRRTQVPAHVSTRWIHVTRYSHILRVDLRRLQGLSHCFTTAQPDFFARLLVVIFLRMSSLKCSLVVTADQLASYTKCEQSTRYARSKTRIQELLSSSSYLTR